MSQENVELVRREHADFNRTGRVTRERYHDEFEFHDFEGAPIPVRHGFDEWRQWAHDVSEAFGEFVLEPQELLDLGDQVVAVVVMRGRGKGSGVNLEQLYPPFAVVWTVRDGKSSGGPHSAASLRRSRPRRTYDRTRDERSCRWGGFSLLWTRSNG